jgi:hypothetical protein
MNKDSQKIWESYKSHRVEEQTPGLAAPVAAPTAAPAPVAPAAPAPAKPPSVEGILQDVETKFANGIGPDEGTVGEQINALNTASTSLSDMYGQLKTAAGSQIDSAGRLGAATMVGGGYPAQAEIDKIKQAFQLVGKLTQEIKKAFPHLGPQLESLQESLQRLGQLLGE